MLPNLNRLFKDLCWCLMDLIGACDTSLLTTVICIWTIWSTLLIIYVVDQTLACSIVTQGGFDLLQNYVAEYLCCTQTMYWFCMLQQYFPGWQFQIFPLQDCNAGQWFESNNTLLRSERVALQSLKHAALLVSLLLKKSPSNVVQLVSELMYWPWVCYW